MLDRFRVTGATLRLMLFGGTICFAMAVFEPKSLMTVLFGGHKLFPVLMVVLAAIGIAETVINDLMSNPFEWKWAQNLRHLMLIFCFFFFAVIIALCVERGTSWAAYPVFGLFAAFLVFHTFLDLRARYKW
jgi:hypothetical protein